MKINKSFLVITLLSLLTISLTASISKAKKKSHAKTHVKTNSHSHAKSHSKSNAKDTPRGMDLRNHYGTPNIANQYGPQDDGVAQYVVANPDTFAPMLGAKNRTMLLHANDFIPYPGYEKKMNPSPVKAGDYTNIAPNASHEVNPEITGPKLEVNGQIEYPMAMKVPTFYGFSKEIHPVIAYDKLTGEIIEDNVVIDRPVYNYENRVSNVARGFTKHFDLRNGQEITVRPNLRKFGINQVTTDWVPPVAKKNCASGTGVRRRR